MPYYSAGDYYTAGDHIYGRGDFLGLGKAFKSVTKFVGGLGIPIVSQASALANRIVGGGSATPGIPQIAPPAMPVVVPEPGISGFVHRMVPGGDTGLRVDTGGAVFGRRPGDTGRVGHFKKNGEWTNRARPRMQVTNTRALKRAGRRVRGFLKVASRLGALPVSRSGKGKLFRRKRR